MHDYLVWDQDEPKIITNGYTVEIKAARYAKQQTMIKTLESSFTIGMSKQKEVQSTASDQGKAESRVREANMYLKLQALQDTFLSVALGKGISVVQTDKSLLNFRSSSKQKGAVCPCSVIIVSHSVLFWGHVVSWVN